MDETLGKVGLIQFRLKRAPLLLPTGPSEGLGYESLGNNTKHTVFTINAELLTWFMKLLVTLLFPAFGPSYSWFRLDKLGA